MTAKTKQYDVYLVYSVGEPISVKARDPDQAIDKASQQSAADLCHYCSRDLNFEDIIGQIVTETDTGKEVFNDVPNVVHDEEPRLCEPLYIVDDLHDDELPTYIGHDVATAMAAALDEHQDVVVYEWADGGYRYVRDASHHAEGFWVWAQRDA